MLLSFVNVPLILPKMSVHILQPINLRKSQKEALARLVSSITIVYLHILTPFIQPPLPKNTYITFLKNALDGGAYTFEFKPFVPYPS
jgi:hypothetical protein